MRRGESATARRARYQNRRALGLCGRCDVESGPKAYCFRHRIIEAATSKRRRDAAKLARVLARHAARQIACELARKLGRRVA